MKTTPIVLILLFIFSCGSSLAQQNTYRLSVLGGYSFNGTGDLDGYAISNEFFIPLRKRLLISTGFQLTNHSKVSSTIDWRIVVTGINFFTNINYNILKNEKHALLLGAGPMIRFQSSTLPDRYGRYLNQQGEYILFFEHDDPMRTTAFGYNINASYQYQLSSKFYLGIKSSIQNDTEGDVISALAIGGGVKF